MNISSKHFVKYLRNKYSTYYTLDYIFISLLFRSKQKYDTVYQRKKKMKFNGKNVGRFNYFTLYFHLHFDLFKCHCLISICFSSISLKLAICCPFTLQNKEKHFTINPHFSMSLRSKIVYEYYNLLWNISNMRIDFRRLDMKNSDKIHAKEAHNIS